MQCATMESTLPLVAAAGTVFRGTSMRAFTVLVKSTPPYSYSHRANSSFLRFLPSGLFYLLTLLLQLSQQ